IRIIGDLVVQGRVDDDIGRNNEYGVAVRCCPCRLTHTDVAASTADVLDVELFPEMLGQTLCDQAAEYIRRTTGRVWNDHTHGSCRIGLRPSSARHGRQRSSARGQTQKISAEKFHFEPPSRFTSLDRLVGAAEQSGWKAERLPGRAFVARQAALEDL